MKNLNICLNLCSSAFDWKLGCSTLDYLVLTEQPAVFITHCSTEFLPTTNPGIHPVMPGPAPTAAIFSKLVITHKHEVSLFNKYHAVDQACKKFISQFIPEKHYKLNHRLCNSHMSSYFDSPYYQVRGTGKRWNTGNWS